MCGRYQNIKNPKSKVLSLPNLPFPFPLPPVSIIAGVSIIISGNIDFRTKSIHKEILHNNKKYQYHWKDPTIINVYALNIQLQNPLL